MMGAVVLGCVALAGCGSSSNSGTGNSTSGPSADRAQVIALGTRYDNAISAQHAADACGLMTPGLQDQFVKKVGVGGDCQHALEHIFSVVTSLGAAKALVVTKKIEITSVRIHGNAADVKLRLRYRGRTIRSHAQAQKTQDGWRISCCVGRGTPG